MHLVQRNDDHDENRHDHDTIMTKTGTQIISHKGTLDLIRPIALVRLKT